MQSLGILGVRCGERICPSSSVTCFLKDCMVQRMGTRAIPTFVALVQIVNYNATWQSSIPCFNSLGKSSFQSILPGTMIGGDADMLPDIAASLTQDFFPGGHPYQINAQLTRNMVSSKGCLEPRPFIDKMTALSLHMSGFTFV